MNTDKEKYQKIIAHLQATVEHMKLDDIEENPEAAEQYFNCNCCGEDHILAGSLLYGDFVYCNNCVLLTELSMALNKITDPREMIDIQKEKRFNSTYKSLFPDQKVDDELECED